MEWVKFFSYIALLVIIFSAAFAQWQAWIWVSLLAADLALITWLSGLTVVATTLWVIFAIVAIFALAKPLRQILLWRPMLPLLKRKIPTISATEREAIDAGDTWWEKELFCGRPDWQKLLSIPKPTLSHEEESFLNNQVEKLCSMLDDWKIVFEDHDLPPAIWDYLKQERFFGMVIDKAYGGLGFSALAHSTVVAKIASKSLSAAVTTMVPNSLGPGELLTHYGTKEQKDYYLPRLARGEEIPCFALTAPAAGSDAGSIPDRGIVCKGMHDGKEVLGMRLTWDKRYITLAPVATVLGLAVQLYDPEHLLGTEEDVGITLCLIPTSHPGVKIGHRHYPMQLAFMNGPTRGKDVFIPLDWIIGGPSMAGQGWRMLMECLSIGRSISLPALATASAKVSYRYTGAYARLRRQFNVAIASFEGIEEALGYIAGYTYILEACRLMTAGAVDLKINPSTVSAIAKYHMTELGRNVVSHAMDVHAGHMIQTGPRNFLATMHTSSPISITVEGANILTRNLIIFGQGAIRCHPYILKEAELISRAETPLAELDKTLMGHIGYFASNLLRNIAYGLTGGLLIKTKLQHAELKYYEKQLTRMSAALALQADLSLMLLGGSLKRRERISARLGDILSQLYVASAVIKYFHDQQQPESDIDYVKWALQNCLAKIQAASNELAENYPYRSIAALLHSCIFPWGSAYSAPSDKLHQKLLPSLLSPSALRERLTQYCYISQQTDETRYRLDAALSQAEEMEALAKKLHKAVKAGVIADYLLGKEKTAAAVKTGTLSAAEAEAFNQYQELINQIIMVNEFSFDLKQVIA